MGDQYDIRETTTAQLLFFTETDYNGDEFIVNFPGDNSVLVVKSPTNFQINSMKIDTRFYVQFFSDYLDIYANSLYRYVYTGNVSSPDNFMNLITKNYIRITFSHSNMKTIIGKRDPTDPSIEYCSMTPIDFSKPMKKVEVYTDTMYYGLQFF